MKPQFGWTSLIIISKITKRRKRRREESKRTKGRRPILKRVGAPLLKLFTVHRKKCLVLGEPEVFKTLEQANNRFVLTHRDRGPPHHVEVAVDWCRNAAFISPDVS